MNERVKRLTEEIRKLSPEEQAEIIDELLVLTYREPNPEIDKAWVEEAKRRMQRHRSGEEPGIPADEAIAQVRAKLARRRGT
jgi:putative addiction module component (TIGR02574 family)